MPDDHINNPHDRFARHALRDTTRAAQYIEQFLPVEVTRELDLTRLKPVDTVIVDSALDETLSDLVFEAPLRRGGVALVAILFEHKSYPDKLTSLQVLGYMVRIMQQRIRDQLPLCCVIPLVLYNGLQPWNVARSLDELIEVPESMRCYIPKFELPLLDLSQFSDLEPRESVLSVVLWVLKYSRHEDLLDRLWEAFDMLSTIGDNPTTLDLFEAMLRYVAQASKHITPDELREAVVHGVTNQPLRKQGLDIMPTIAETWIQQGLDRGIEKGKRQLLLGQLAKKFGDLPSDMEARIEAIDSNERLDELSLKILDASNLDELFGA